MAGRGKGFRIFANIVMALLSVMCLLPFVLLLVSSLTKESTITASGYSFLIRDLDFSAYRYLFASGDSILRAYGMTLLVTTVGTILNLFMTLFFAYLLSKKDLPGRNVLSFYVFFTMLFSGGMIPSYIIWSQVFKVSETIFGLLLPNLLMNAFNIILMRTFLTSNIPQEIFGEEELEEYTFEAEVKMQKDNPVTFSIWNHHPDTDAGCNEPRDTKWTSRSVRNQIWKIENGVSVTRNPHMFEKPLTSEEQTPVEIDYTKYNCYKIICDHFGYKCYINDKLVDQKRHVLHPLVSAVAVQDREYVYLKAVNVDSHDLDIQIKLDCNVDQDGEVEILQGALQEVNSFECKNKVSTIKRKVTCGADFVYHIPAYSVNVIKMKKERSKE